jgi:uncharacterized Fe-S center protein
MKKIKSKESRVFFADVSIASMEANKTLPAKFQRMLKKLNLAKRVKDKSVAIKMHLGRNMGYTTVHPVFVRLIVEECKKGDAKSVKVIEEDPTNGVARGYTQEVLGCPVVPCFGATGKYVYKEKIGFKEFDEALLSGEAVDCDFFIDLSHVKGHGDCGFGGAIKNIAMGLVPSETRYKIHHLEGGLTFNKKLCKFCLKCQKACPNNAIRPDKEKKVINFFLHHCTYCQHCEMICPTGAIKMEGRKFEDFTEGMAIITAKFLKKFKPENLLFINFLMDITIFCDCWGMSTPSIVPDIGILGSFDIAAIETASLDMIKVENFLPNGLPKGRKLLDKGTHLFERIHAKDPYLMIKNLKEIYECNSEYNIEVVK